MSHFQFQGKFLYNNIGSWYSTDIKNIVTNLLNKDISKRFFIDEVIDIMIQHGYKLSNIDKENLERYRKCKPKFYMENIRKPYITFRILINQLQENIMKDSLKNSLEQINLEDEIIKKKRKK